MENVLKLKLINRKLPPYIWKWFSKYKNPDEQEGDSLEFYNTYGQKFTEFIPYGQTSQESTTGKNKLQNNGNASATSNTVSFTKNADGTVTVNGTALPSNATYQLNPNINSLETNTSYILNGCIGGADNTYRIQVNINGQALAVSTNGDVSFTTPSEITSLYIFIQVSSGVTVNNVIFKPMIRLSSVIDDTYEPYTGGYSSPSPNWEQPINNTTGDNIIKVENFNLWDEKWEIGGYNTTTGIKNNDPDKIRNKNPICCKENTQYYLCIKDIMSGEAIRLLYYDKNGTFLSTVANIKNQIITTPANTYYINMMFNTTYGTEYKSNVCLNLSSATLNGTYVAHQEQTVTFPLGTEKMYEGNYLADDGIHHVMGEIEFDGSNDENWGMNGNKQGYSIAVSNVGGGDNGYTQNVIFCNKLRATRQIDIYNGAKENVVASLGGTISKIYIRFDSSITTVSDLKIYLASNPITVQYLLATPTITPYTETQQEAWNNIKELHTYLDYTSISQINDELPFKLKVKVN